jgi:8-oxo-dGTP pyrophosphatase MutT (NUDIX family)
VAGLRGNARPSLKRARATSAGGIVLREGPDGTEIVLGKRSRPRDGETWTLPKGTPIAGETTEETALREVTEETGLLVGIVMPIGAIQYYFVQGGARIHKTVHYFLMEPTGGDLSDHDVEFDDVRWLPVTEAERLLSHETERAIMTRGLEAYASVGASAPGGTSRE